MPEPFLSIPVYIDMEISLHDMIELSKRCFDSGCKVCQAGCDKDKSDHAKEVMILSILDAIQVNNGEFIIPDVVGNPF